MPASSTRTRPPAVIAALVISIALGALASAAIATVVRGVADIPSDFGPFNPSAYIFFTVLGVIGGLIGWLVIRRRANNPAAVLRVLVPGVVLLSLVPDILLGLNKSMPGTTWAGVIGLMAMHLAVAAAAVPTFAKFLPLPRPAQP